MVDKIRPLKIENSLTGTETDLYPTETDPSEDYLSGKGVSLEGLDSHLINITDNEVSFTDPVNGTLKVSEIISGGGLTEGSHRLLDQLIHGIAENSYMEITRVSGKVTTIIIWTSVAKTQKIRSVDITRNSGKVSSVVTKQYNGVGSVLETFTQTITRDITNKVMSITGVLT